MRIRRACQWSRDQQRRHEREGGGDPAHQVLRSILVPARFPATPEAANRRAEAPRHRWFARLKLCCSARPVWLTPWAKGGCGARL